MNNPYPKVNIVVLNYNGQDCLKRCLMSLFCLDYPNLEIVVVDNASQDGSFESARRDFSRATFIRNDQNLGFSAGNNVGIKYSLERMADFVLLLNNDTEVDKEFLARLVDKAMEKEAAGLFSPLILSPDGSVWFSGGKLDWWRMKALHQCDQTVQADQAADFLSGCALLVRTEVFKQIGLLDEDFFLYWEDVDFSFRAKQAGFGLCLVPESQIVHWEKSEELKKNKVYWLVFSGLLFFRKNASFFQKIWINPYVFLRRIKNWRDVRRRPTEINQAVRKAYRDFIRANRKKNFR